MPFIDVTEVLSSPDVAAVPFVVLRRQQTVGANGVVTTTEVPTNTIGSVRPSGDQGLDRRDDFQAQAKSIRVVTTFRLRGASQSGGLDYQPDVILWRGGRFIVASVEDYSQYGIGMIQADCSEETFQDVPPA